MHFLACLASLIAVLYSAARIRAINTSSCVPSSCGNISISYPFRLRGDPPNCGHPDSFFLLECQQNRTVLKTKTRRYYVQAITYSNFSARISDPGVDSQNYSSCPIHYSSDNELYPSYIFVNSVNRIGIAFINCLKPVDNPLYVKNPFCANTTALSNSSQVHGYLATRSILVSDLEESCTFDAMAEASSPTPLTGSDYTYSQIHDMMAYGIELSWYRPMCVECEESMGSCTLENNKIRCSHYCDEHAPLSERSFLCKLDYYLPYIFISVMAVGSIIGLRFLCGILFLIGLVMHKYKRRPSSANNSVAIEVLLGLQTNLMPINYSYKEIKKMTSNFKAKLGEEIDGTVFKGKLRSGPPVVVKMMSSSISDQDFFRHVSTTAKVNHPNIAKLIGFCVEVHHFVQCGSLDKHICLQEGMVCSLTSGQMFQICLGIGRGIQCLHGVQTSHVGINPRNILLDEDFNPKIVAKLCDHRVKAKGKMGFVAPEVFYKNIGQVSCKADVYSFGMMVLEMAARLQSQNPHSNNSSKKDFSPWIYKQLSEGKEVEMRDADEEQKKMVKRMVFVGLWCIQIRPEDRPLMSEVVVMLERETDALQMPPNPFKKTM